MFLIALLSALRPFCSLPSPSMCLLQLPICTCLNSPPIACPPSSVLCWCILYLCAIKQLLCILLSNCIILCPLYIVSVNIFCHHVFFAYSVSVFVWTFVTDSFPLFSLMAFCFWVLYYPFRMSNNSFEFLTLSNFLQYTASANVASDYITYCIMSWFVL